MAGKHIVFFVGTAWIECLNKETLRQLTVVLKVEVVRVEVALSMFNDWIQKIIRKLLRIKLSMTFVAIQVVIEIIKADVFFILIF